MTTLEEIIVTLPGGRRVDAYLRGHTVRTDQPKENGGGDTAPSPFELFLASIGTCAGIFVQGFCAARGIDTEGISIRQRLRYGGGGALEAVALELLLPPSFPERYREALVRVVDQCSVKKAIAAQPAFTVTTVVAEPAVEAR